MFCKRTGAVVVATVRALKLHGGAPPVKAGKPLADVYKSEHLDVLKLGTFLSFYFLLSLSHFVVLYSHPRAV